MQNKIPPRVADLYAQWQFMRFWVNSYLKNLTDEELEESLAPGLNPGKWILGHMIASEDDLSLFTGKGELLFPEYQEKFPMGGKTLPPEAFPATAQMRRDWEAVLAKSGQIYFQLSDDDLDQPHLRVEDPEKDHFKNIRNIIINWNLHQVHHAGQLAQLCAKFGKKVF